MSSGQSVRIALSLVIMLCLVGCATESGVDKSNAAAALANIGADYLRKNDNDRAEKAFEHALRYKKSNFTANWGLAVVNERENNPAAARRYFEKALAVQKSPVVYNSYAAFLCKQGDTAQGVKMFQQALATKNTTDKADTLANAGLCLARANQDDAAQQYFGRALSLDPKQPTALTQMAELAYHAHDYMKARAYIERADSATTLTADQLRLGAHIETALNDDAAAQAYMKRYQNANQPATTTGAPGPREPSQQ